MTDSLTIWKIGGNVLSNASVLDEVLTAYTEIPGRKILVHGGGPQASTISSRLGIEPQMAGGRRLTDGETLEVVVMVYAGLINKNLVAALQAKGTNALGLCGADGDIIRAHKRAVGEIDYGFAGDIEPQEQPSKTLRSLLSLGISPVFCALTHDGKGQLLNTNADTIASHLAQQLCSDYQVRLLFCFDKPGVLLDPQDPNSLISALTPEKYQELKKQGRIVDGMVPKLDNAFLALKEGVKDIYLCDWQVITNKTKGGTKLCMS